MPHIVDPSGSTEALERAMRRCGRAVVSLSGAGVPPRAMNPWRALSPIFAAAVTALLCAIPWIAPGVGTAFDGLDLALAGGVTAVGLVATLIASARRRPSRGFTPESWVWVTPLLTLLAVVPIAVAWRSGRSNGAFLAGVIPYSDAGDYLQGAYRLLHEGALEPWSSRRPLNSALLAARLVLVRHSPERALVLQALLLAFSSALGARAVALDHGRRAGITVGAGVMIFGAIYTPTSLSESLGLTLGSLALAALWHASRTASAWAFGAGLGALTVALNARAGPFFALPTLLLWGLWRARGSLRGFVSTLVASLSSIAAAFAFNRALIAVHHGNTSGLHGNFSYSLWGLAHGGVPWDRALTAHPEVLAMGDAEAASHLYNLAARQILEHPGALLTGLWVNVLELVAMVIDPLTGDATSESPFAQTAIFAALVAGALFAVRRVLRSRPDDDALRMSLAAVLGLALSVPVIFLDGRVRVFAAGFPLAVAAIVATVAARRGDAVGPVSAHREAAKAPVALLAMLVIAAMVLPRLGRRHDSVNPTTCRSGEATFALATFGSPLRRRIVAGGTGVLGESVPLETLHARIARDPNLGFTQLDDQLRALREGDLVIAGLDLLSSRFEYFVFPAGTRVRRGAVVSGCAERPAREFRQFRRVRRLR